MAFGDVLKELSNPVRRDILVMLKNGSLSAGEIGERFSLTAATISYHLSHLKKADLVFERKEKNFIYYEINLSVFEEVLVWLSQFQKEGEVESENQET